eukprot:scaffold28499_cov65-Phaeocystis_antarctica.AAC.5
MPFGFLVAVITSFRLSDAYHKYERAAGLLTAMHGSCRETTARLCAYVTPGNEEAIDLALQIRRLLVLGCVLIKEFVRGEKSDLAEEHDIGLLTASERQLLVNTMCIVAPSVVATDDDGAEQIDERLSAMTAAALKKDRYPSKNRAAFAFQQAQLINSQLHRRSHYSVPHTYMAVEAGICHCASIYEEVEHFGGSVLPLPYAQLTRLIALLFLCLVPISTVHGLGWGVIPLCFFANLVYFLVDDVASQMEVPFGHDANDVDLEKMIRRIDKHTAAQMSLLVRPHPNPHPHPSPNPNTAAQMSLLPSQPHPPHRAVLSLTHHTAPSSGEPSGGALRPLPRAEEGRRDAQAPRAVLRGSQRVRGTRPPLEGGEGNRVQGAQGTQELGRG